VHYQTPLMILAASAALVACARGLVSFARPVRAGPAVWQAYAGALCCLPVLALVAVGNGLTLNLCQMSLFRAQAYGITTYRFPDMGGPARYLQAHRQKGDLILSTLAHQVNNLLGQPGAVDYYLDVFPPLLELPDNTPIPVEHRSGANGITNLKEVVDLCNRHKRIWCVAMPAALASGMGPFGFIREQMEVVYESHGTVVLFWGGRHWTAAQRASWRAAPGSRGAGAGTMPVGDVPGQAADGGAEGPGQGGPGAPGD